MNEIIFMKEYSNLEVEFYSSVSDKVNREIETLVLFINKELGKNVTDRDRQDLIMVAQDVKILLYKYFYGNSIIELEKDTPFYRFASKKLADKLTRKKFLGLF